MDGLFPDRRVWRTEAPSFGPSRYGAEPACETLVLPRPSRLVRKLVRAHVPRCPGVYGMIDELGELLYVGMSAHLRDRLLTYFTSTRRHTKERRIARHAARLVWETHDHDLIAQLRELELIRRWRPRFNTRGRPGRHEIGYVYLTSGAAPKLCVGGRIPQSVTHCWGPLPLSGLVRQAVDQLNHVFRLRDCPDRTPIRYAEQTTLLSLGEHTACLRRDLGTCLAPCCGGCSQQDYAQSLAAVRALLDGRDNAMMDHYESAMREAAAAESFEQAAIYRDIWQQLQLIHNQLQRLRDVQRDFWYIYPLRRGTATPKWMLIAGGRIAALVAVPRSAPAARKCLTLLEQTFEQHAITAVQDYDHVRLVTAWFRQRPDQQRRLLEPDAAREICLRQLDGNPSRTSPRSRKTA